MKTSTLYPLHEIILNMSSIINMIKRYALIFALLFIGIIGSAQLPGEAGNFDIRGNVYSGTPTAQADDWFPGTTGTGIGLIDTSQAEIWRNITQTLPPAAGSNIPFTVGASHQLYEFVNGSLQYQSLYARDYVNFNSLESGNVDQTVFTGGVKNGDSPQDVWGILTKTVLSKNDLVDNYIHLRRAGASSADSMWLNIGLSVLGSGGNHFVDVELIASDIDLNAAGDGFVNSGNEEGKNEWTFDTLSGNIISSGDLIVGFA